MLMSCTTFGMRHQPLLRPLWRAGSDALGVLVGNTREFWDLFVDACRTDPSLMEREHPLDTFVTEAITHAAQQLPNQPTRIYWSHVPATDLVGGAPFVAMQRLAAAVGLAYLDEASHLCLHPKHGPWFSMRALLIWDDVSYAGTLPASPTYPDNPAQRRAPTRCPTR